MVKVGVKLGKNNFYQYQDGVVLYKLTRAQNDRYNILHHWYFMMKDEKIHQTTLKLVKCDKSYRNYIKKTVMSLKNIKKVWVV